MAKNGKEIGVEALNHKHAKRRNIPTAEFESVMRQEEKTPIRLAYERRSPIRSFGHLSAPHRTLFRSSRRADLVGAWSC